VEVLAGRPPANFQQGRREDLGGIFNPIELNAFLMGRPHCEFPGRRIGAGSLVSAPVVPELRKAQDG